MNTDTAGNPIIEIISNCDCGLTAGCQKCNPILLGKAKKVSKCAFGHTVYLRYSGGSDTNPLPVCKVCGKIVI